MEDQICPEWLAPPTTGGYRLPPFPPPARADVAERRGALLRSAEVALAGEDAARHVEVNGISGLLGWSCEPLGGEHHEAT